MDQHEKELENFKEYLYQSPDLQRFIVSEKSLEELNQETARDTVGINKVVMAWGIINRYQSEVFCKGKSVCPGYEDGLEKTKC